MNKALKEAAKAGRFGDTELLHVSKEELRGLASLHPEGRLPKNPDTGLPEAFFFLPFLAGIGSALGGTAAATAATALPAAATAAAIPAATTAATLGTAALPVAAETAALGALPATTAALPALEGAMGTSSLIGSGGLDTLAATAPVTANAPLFTPAMEAATTGAITPSPLASAVAPTTTTPLTTTASPLSTAIEAPSTIPGLNAVAPAGPELLGPAPSTTSGLLGGGGLSQLLQYGAMGALMMPPGGDEMEEEDEPKIGKDTYRRGRADFSGSGGDGEHDYFPNSGYSNKSKAKKIKFASGGMVRGFAEGGLASMEGGEQAPMDDADLIDATKDAILEQSPEADALIQMFLATFGKQALQDLITGIQQSGAPGQQSDGMSDSIPAQIDGAGSQGLASLSEGEYVIPSEVVSGLGNGSTDAGAKQLDGMVDRVRQVRNGGKSQPPPINPSDVIPG